MIIQVIEQSFKALKSKQKTTLTTSYPTYKSIFKNTSVVAIMPQLRKILAEDEKSKFIKSLDRSLYEVHFLNGYVDMKTKEFKERDIKLKPVTYVIPRDFKMPSEKAINSVKKTFMKIIPNPDDFKILMLITALTLAGDAVKDQTSLFF